MDEKTLKQNYYVASFEKSGQVGPDTWSVWLETKVCNSDTTIREIVEWFTKLCPESNKMPEIKLTKPT